MSTGLKNIKEFISWYYFYQGNNWIQIIYLNYQSTIYNTSTSSTIYSSCKLYYAKVFLRTLIEKISSKFFHYLGQRHTTYSTIFYLHNNITTIRVLRIFARMKFFNLLIFKFMYDLTKRKARKLCGTYYSNFTFLINQRQH